VAIPIINNWQNYYPVAHEGLGSSYERIVLNLLLMRLHERYGFSKALETPAFGFTGLSGINLVALAQAGCAVSLEDSDEERLGLIRGTWQELGLPLCSRLNPDFTQLDYPDGNFDFAFNFSAIWFVKDLSLYISELCRVTDGAILICVPNQDGIGFKGQLKGYSAEQYPQLTPSYIDPASIIHLMRCQGRQLVEWDYIDCPPWPDIGMTKEDFARGLIGQGSSQKTKPELKPEDALSIMPYYKGEDPDFAQRMLKLYPFEKLAPRYFKRYWAHHMYYLFVQ